MKITEYKIKSDKISKKIKIALVSDLHDRPVDKIIDTLFINIYSYSFYIKMTSTSVEALVRSFIKKPLACLTENLK